MRTAILIFLFFSLLAPGFAISQSTLTEPEMILSEPGFDPSGQTTISDASVVKGSGKKVFGYLTYGDVKWTSSSYGTVPVDSIPWDVLTHVTLFAAGGGVPIPSSYANQVPYMTTKAHATGTYAGLCYGGSGDAALISMVNNPSSWPAWIKYNLGLIDNQGLDFLEFDFENSISGTTVYAFFDVLYDSLQSRRSDNNPAIAPFIVLTVGPSRAASWSNLRPFVSMVNMMSYDYSGDWWGRIIHDSSPKSYKNWNGTGTNLDYYAPVGSTNAPAPSMQQAVLRVKNAGWPVDKILVGFDVNPTYWHGGSFSDGRGPTYIRKPTNGSTQTAGSALDFNTQWSTLSQIPRDSVHFDQIAQAYWAHTGTSLANDKLWVIGALPGRDSSVWATRKVVDSMNAGGVMFWNLGSELWNTSSVPPGGRGWFYSQIRKHFGGGASPPPPADLTPPSIDLTAPANGATVSGMVTLSAQAFDNVGVSSVQFSVNGSALGAAVTAAPWTKSWNTAGLAIGNYKILATASDAAGLKSFDSATVIVSASIPGDVTPPTVSVTAPLTGATVVGTVQVSVDASDASGIGTVKFKVDGAFTGAADASAPYSFIWNSTTVPNGSHTLAAEATDGAGLKSTAGIQVTVNNPVAPPPPDGGAVTGIYVDMMVSPWIAASWGSVNTYNSTERVYEGSSAIKTVQNAWGALMPRSGSWSSPVALNTAGYDSLRIAVYPEVTGLSLAVWFGNDGGATFPKVTKSSIPAGRWTVISIPVAALNPRGQAVNTVYIQNNTSQSRTYHVDRVVLGVKSAAMMAVPVIPPANLSITPGSLTLTDLPQGEVETRYVTVTNEGDQEYRVDSVTSTEQGITVSPSGGTIAPNDSLVFAIAVATRSRTGGVSGFLLFSGNGLDVRDSILVEATIAGAGLEASAKPGDVGIESVVPTQYSLSQNYPNPFNPTTTIGFGLPQASRVTVRIYNMIGQEVARVFDGEVGAGFGSVVWNGRSDAGATLATGIYIYRIEAVAIEGGGAPFVESKRMLLVK